MQHNDYMSTSIQNPEGKRKKGNNKIHPKNAHITRHGRPKTETSFCLRKECEFLNTESECTVQIRLIPNSPLE